MPPIIPSFLQLLALCSLMMPLQLAAAANQETSSLAQALDRATELNLAKHPLWLGLLHFDAETSQIESPEFFLAENGRRDPAAELQANLRAFFLPSGASADDHARCRFPARLQWLRAQLEFKLPPHTCRKFDYYALDGDIESISMVFVAGHFKSPASFFGHNLLKFNNSKTDADHLLEPTINYGAIVPDNESPLRYIAMGVFGGYKASFSRDQFFRLYQKYAERELRDIWEYPLNLTSQEIRLIVAHAWELTNMKITYYFFRENCAYQIASLLNVVMEEKLVPEKLPWSMPYNVFDKLSAARRNGEPFTRELKYFPSRKSRFEDKFLALSAGARDKVRTYISSSDKPLALQQLVRHSPANAVVTAQIIDTLLDYYQYRIRSNDREEDQKIKTALLLERLKLPVNSATESDRTTTRIAPHLGQKPTMVRSSFVYNSDNRRDNHRSDRMSGIELHIRPAYYDLLNLEPGRMPFSAFSMLDIKLSAFADDLNLDSLRLVTALNLNPSTIALNDDRKRSWLVSFGAENHSLACKDCLVAFTSLAMGRSTRLARSVAAYALGGFYLQSSLQQSGHAAVQLLTGITGKLTPWWSAHLHLGMRRYVDGDESERTIAGFEHRFGSSRTWDIRLSLQKNIATEAKLSVSAYF